MAAYEIIKRLVLLDGEFSELASACEALKATSDPIPDQQSEAYVTLRMVDLEKAIKRFTSGSLSAEQLEEWAEILEMNDYVEYESGSEQIIADALFLLATPEVNGPITERTVENILRSLGEK